MGGVLYVTFEPLKVLQIDWGNDKESGNEPGKCEFGRIAQASTVLLFL